MCCNLIKPIFVQQKLKPPLTVARQTSKKNKKKKVVKRGKVKLILQTNGMLHYNGDGIGEALTFSIGFYIVGIVSM